jgi:hypothetical protein
MPLMALLVATQYFLLSQQLVVDMALEVVALLLAVMAALAVEAEMEAQAVLAQAVKVVTVAQDVTTVRLEVAVALVPQVQRLQVARLAAQGAQALHLH